MASPWIDHVTITVSNIEASFPFYKKALEPMGITEPFIWVNETGPPEHPKLHGLGRGRRFCLWLKEGDVRTPAHIGFIANSVAEVQASYNAAILAGATPDMTYGGPPGERVWYLANYYAANVRDPDGNELEFTYKSYEHPESGTEPGRASA